MCSPESHRSACRGFTLLEIQVALVLLALATFGYVKLAGAQGSTINEMDAWCRGNPTYVLAPAARATERELGLPAALYGEAEEPPARAATPEGPNDVTVVRVQRAIAPLRAEAVVHVLVPPADDGDDKGKGKGKGKGKQDKEKRDKDTKGRSK